MQALVLLDDTPRRMALIRQFGGGIDEGAAALRQVALELTEMAQPGEELCRRIAENVLTTFVSIVAQTEIDFPIVRASEVA